jgi:hypothetical protein
MLADGVVQLDPTAEEQRQARAALLALLADQTARAALLEAVAGQADGGVAFRTVQGVVQLATMAGERSQARDELLRLLAGQRSPGSWLAERDVAERSGSHFGVRVDLHVVCIASATARQTALPEWVAGRAASRSGRGSARPGTDASIRRSGRSGSRVDMGARSWRLAAAASAVSVAAITIGGPPRDEMANAATQDMGGVGRGA